MSVREYVGARYVPLFADPVNWDASKVYEPLTIVLYQGSSYTSKQVVPAGIDIHNESYWVETGNFNAQMAEYHQDTIEAKETADEALESATYDDQQVNNTYKGRNLATVLADEIAEAGNIYTALHNRVQAANYDGLRVGDYMDVPLTPLAGTITQNSVRYVIAAFDHYYDCSDSPINHHIVFVPQAPINMNGSSYATNGSYIMWNTTNTNQGTSSQQNPYLNSNLHRWELDEYLGKLPSTLQGYLLNYRNLVEQRYSASGNLDASTLCAWASLGKIWSLSEMEVYGNCVWGTPIWTTGGIDSQLPIFQAAKNRIMGTHASWWLRVVAGNSDSGVCDVSAVGIAGSLPAAHTTVQPRPCFLLG